MSETPLFIANGDYRLYAMLHTPDDGATHAPLKGYGAVLCHPFAEEKLIAHRAMVNLARSLTAHGATCLRFDEMGHGDSEGNFEDATIETRLSDIRCAVEHVKSVNRSAKLGLLGVRLGATLAALASASMPRIDFLVMIEPVIDGGAYFEQCLRSNLATQTTLYGKILKDRKQLVNDLMDGQLVNIDGYLISRPFYEQINAIRLQEGQVPNALNVLLVQVSQRESQPLEKRFQELQRRYQLAGIDAELASVQEDQFWKDGKIYSPKKRNIEQTVLMWLQRASING